MPEVPTPPEEPRILLLRLSALGDVVFALPALRALRMALPGAHLEWLTEDRHAGLLQDHPDLDGLRLFPRRRGVSASLQHFLALRKSGPWDAVLDFQGNLKSALHLCFLRSKLKVGFGSRVSREGAHFFLHDKIELSQNTPRAFRDWALVHRLAELWGFDLADPAEILAQGMLWPLPSEMALPPNPGGTVLLHASTTFYGRDKAWPESSWQELAVGLQRSGFQVLWLWTEAEKQRIQTLAQKSAGVMAPATPELTDLMAICDRSDLLIGTDSGPLHLAAWRQSAVLGLFGATDPAIYGPVGPRVQILSGLPAGASPPPRRRDRASPLLAALSVQAVLEQAKNMHLENPGQQT